jgi:hypothetical protein
MSLQTLFFSDNENVGAIFSHLNKISFKPHQQLSTVMREIVSILLNCDVRSKRDMNERETEEVLTIFTRTVLQHKPHMEVAYRTMKTDLWEWCAATLPTYSADRITEQVSFYIETLTASRNAERMFQLWQSTRPLEEADFVVTCRPGGGSSADGSSSPKLSDWWFIGQKVEWAQMTCRTTLCQTMVSAFTSLRHLDDMYVLQPILAKITQVALEHHPSQFQLMSSTRPKKGPSIDTYRNLVECPALGTLHEKFADPSFFGWKVFATASHQEKRAAGVRLFRILKSSMHETSVFSVLIDFVSSVFRDGSECVGTADEFASRISTFDDPDGFLLDAAALQSFGSLSIRVCYDIVRAGFSSLVSKIGMVPALGPLRSLWTERLKTCLSVIPGPREHVFTNLMDESFTATVKSWGGKAIDTLVHVVSGQLQQDASPEVLTATSQWWSSVKKGIDLAMLEEVYVPRMLQRCCPQDRHFKTLSESTLDVEIAFATLFFPHDSTAPLIKHRVWQILTDLRSSLQLSQMVQSVLPPSGHLASVAVLSMNVASEEINRLMMPFFPRAFAASLEVVRCIYSSLFQPNRILTWLPYRSTVQCIDRRNGLKFHMTCAHFAVLEKLEEHGNDLKLLDLAETLSIRPGIAEFLLEDLVNAELVVMKRKADHGDDFACLSTTVSAAEADVVDVVELSRRRALELRRRQTQRSRSAVECALVRLFKAGATLPMDRSVLMRHLMIPSSLIVDEDVVLRCVNDLIDRGLLALDPHANMISYIV